MNPCNKKQFEKYLIENFEWFHRHPELPYEEVQTTARIRELLTEAGIEILPYPLETGLVAVVRGEKKSVKSNEQSKGACREADISDKENRVSALRCDIDALPIVEEAEVPYASESKGRMHACGHDLHITAGIGAAILLQERKEELCGTVKFIFQPAEEESHGALKILENDVMDDVECIWGFHADPTNAVGVIGIREGYVTAAVDRFVIRVQGVGCHGAHPDDGIDPIVTSAAIVQGLHSIVGRNVNAFHPALLSVTRIQAGTTWNVIPAVAEMEGTVRTMDREDRILYEKRVREVAERTAEAYGARAETEWTAGPPATYNDGRMAQICEEAAEKLHMKTVPEESSMGGDDFAYYEDRDTMDRDVPGCYVKIGTGVGNPIHHPAFCVDESVILPAAEYLVELLLAGR
ncbi:MAG: amidohydrolase [Lachnospiraceae bacterium]|nr:amidohydrolase [Lachnospiraceae bacterium]